MPAVGNHCRSRAHLSVVAAGSNATAGTTAYSPIFGIYRPGKAQITNRKLKCPEVMKAAAGARQRALVVVPDLVAALGRQDRGARRDRRPRPPPPAQSGGPRPTVRAAGAVGCPRD